jgi:hypothetical protein
MSDQTYNGWTNYATWRVNLEIFDGIDPHDYGWDNLDSYDLGKQLQDYAEELIEMSVRDPQCGTGQHSPSLARDYALAFLADVDWREIADHLIEAYATEED